MGSWGRTAITICTTYASITTNRPEATTFTCHGAAGTTAATAAAGTTGADVAGFAAEATSTTGTAAADTIVITTIT